MACVARCAADTDLCVVEGVMGLFDGRDGRSEAGSTAQLAKWLGAPVVLVVDAWTLARSAAALVAGFASFDPGCAVAGVVLNKTGGAALLGDVVISVQTAARQAAERRHTLGDEVRVLLVHGLLHLLGYDHERGGAEADAMAAEEARVLKRMGWAGAGLIAAANNAPPTAQGR